MENKELNLEVTESEELKDAEIAVAPEEEMSHEQSLKLMSPMQMIVRRFFRSKLSIIGLIMVVSLFLFCWVGPLVYRVSPTEIDKDGKVEYTDENGKNIYLLREVWSVLWVKELSQPLLVDCCKRVATELRFRNSIHTSM